MTRPHLPPAPNVARAVLRYITPDGEQFNTYYIQRVAGWDGDSLALCASAIFEWENTSASKQRCNQVFLIGIVLTDLTTPTAALYEAQPASPIVGQMTTDYLPGNVTAAVCFTTGSRGVGRQGRGYWIGLCEEQLENGRLTPPTATALHDTYHDLQSGLAGAVTGVWGIIHRRQDGAVLNPAVFEAIAQAVVRDLVPDTQVNRLPGRSRPAHRR